MSYFCLVLKALVYGYSIRNSVGMSNIRKIIGVCPQVNLSPPFFITFVSKYQQQRSIILLHRFGSIAIILQAVTVNYLEKTIEHPS